METLALGFAIFALGGAGVLSMLLNRISRPALTHRQIATLMSGPVVVYSYPPLETEMSQEPMPRTEDDVQIQLIRTIDKVAALEKTVEREFARFGGGLEKLADALNQSVNALKAEFVSKADHNAVVDRLSRVEKILYTLCGTALLAVVAAVLANVGLGQ